MKRKIGSRNLNKEITLIVMMGYIALLLLLLCMDYYLITNYQEKNREKEEKALTDCANSVKEAMDDIDDCIYDIYANNKNFNSLTGKLNETEEYSNAYDLYKTLANRVFLEDDLHGIYIFYGGLKKTWYTGKTEILSADVQKYISDELKRELMNDQYPGSRMTLITDDSVCIVTTYRKGNVIISGVYSLGWIEETLKQQFGETTQVYIVENGLLLSQTEETDSVNIVAKTKKEENKFRVWKNNQYFYGQKAENSNLWICMSIPCHLWTYLNLPQLLLIIITACSAIAVIFLQFFIRKELVMPFRELTNTMNQIRQGDLRATPNLKHHFSEIQEVNETLINMVSELERQKMLSYEETIEKQKAQMQYLQLQIKPHFYLNGLKTLNALTMQKKWDKIQELIFNISEHLRYLLQAERELVILEAEVNYVRNYISMQKYMTGRRMECNIDMDEGLDKYQVPTLCLQTFVENSIKYAKLGDSLLVLKINIKIQLLRGENGDFLDIMISDNGEGYPDSVLEEINGNSQLGKKSIGINNLKRRCQIIFGKKAEFNFYNVNGAVSELILPVRE